MRHIRTDDGTGTGMEGGATTRVEFCRGRREPAPAHDMRGNAPDAPQPCRDACRTGSGAAGEAAGPSAVDPDRRRAAAACAACFDGDAGHGRMAEPCGKLGSRMRGLL